MRTVFLILLVTLSFSAAAKSIVISPEIQYLKEIELVAGVDYVVPRCRKWLIKDRHLLSDDSVLKISGGIEVSSGLERKYAKDRITGTIEYSTNSKADSSLVAVLSKSKVVFLSKELVSSIYVSEFSYPRDPNEHCHENS